MAEGVVLQDQDGQILTANEAARELFKRCGFRVSTIEMLMEIK